MQGRSRDARYALLVTRIIAGQARSLRLGVPQSGTRPTSDRVREALFSSLDALEALDGARVLDLYAGSGALGLEAASRGADHVVFVERDAAAARTLRANVARVGEVLNGGAASKLEVTQRTVAAFLRGEQGRWDVIFLDPPYELSEDELTDAITHASALLSETGMLIVERSTRSPEPAWPIGVGNVREKRYGETRVWFAPRETEPTHGR